MGQNVSAKKIIIISNGLEPPFDEGIKKFASRFAGVLRIKLGDRVSVVSVRSSDGIMAKKLFLDKSIRGNIRSYDPDYIIYIPTSSASFASFLRCGVLRMICSRKCRLVMVTLQQYHLSRFAEGIAGWLAPDMILTQSETALKYLSAQGIRAERISAGVDADTFKPATVQEKNNLREKYDLPSDKYIVLHIGHISSLRNLDVLINLKKSADIEVLIVGSTTTVANKKLLEELTSVGIRVMISYVEAIQELYQLADCYLFPTLNEFGAIGVPLSVLEAMACNMPVVTTRFGQLPSMFKEGDGFVYADTDDEFKRAIDGIRIMKKIDTRSGVLRFSWEAVVNDILDKVQCVS
jgi:glycosyltransferase involved in cell wall biosynthesis